MKNPSVFTIDEQFLPIVFIGQKGRTMFLMPST